jgi:hypothetical protein
MPLSPQVGVALTVDDAREGSLYPLNVQEVNRLIWRSSRTYVAARPGSDWRRNIALPGE